MRPSRDRRRLVYCAALLAGVALTLFLFPPRFIAGLQAFDVPPPGDAAQHVVGQRYFLAQPWHWPLLVAKDLAAPAGTNIAFTDSIPLLSLATRLVAGLLPDGIETISFWLALCWTLQPVAAVFALRSAGERRVVPGLAVALLSLCIPSLHWRTGHEALSSHFLILLALGAYFGLVRAVVPRRLLFAGALMLAALLVHPYLMAMVVAVLAAAPCTLWLRGERSWRAAAAGLAAGVAVTAGTAALLGYTAALPDTGFDRYSMNLLSPVYPVDSPLLPSGRGPIDATGGQVEGFQYLGAGIGLLALAALVQAARARRAPLRRHAGLALVCACLLALSLSTRVYAGHVLLLELPTPTVLEHFHASGRFFWPVTYVLLVGGVALVSRTRPASLRVLLLGAALLLQVVDTAHLRRTVRSFYHAPSRRWEIDATAWRRALADSDRLRIWPTVGCGADGESPALLQLLLLASERAVPVNTMTVARSTGEVACDPKPYTEAPLAPGELRVFLPGLGVMAPAELPGPPGSCRPMGPLVACSATGLVGVVGFEPTTRNPQSSGSSR